MNKLTKSARKIGVLLIGVPLFVIGIVLVPLPGPGLLVCLAALAILALEFDWAQRHVDALRQQLDKVTKKAKKRAETKNKKDI